jgi:hypothetical protein
MTSSTTNVGSRPQPVLAQLGVSRRTLFPDLAGLADFVRWKHFHKVGGYKAEC